VPHRIPIIHLPTGLPILHIFTSREEFTNYMFLERAQEAAGINAENWKLFPQVGSSLGSSTPSL